MSFNPDPSKKAKEVIFSQKSTVYYIFPLTFNNVDVGAIRSQKYLGMFHDFKLSFNEHLEHFLARINISIAILCKIQSVLPRETLLTICKLLVSPHFDYGDVIYDQSYND